MARMVRIGIAGLGRGAVLHEALVRQPGCEVVGVCSRHEERARAYATQRGVRRAYASYDALIGDPDVDAVVVATPPRDHVAQAIGALRAGKHVLSEVPAAWTVEECASLVDAVRETQGRATYTFGENANYAVLSRTWESVAARGLIGKVIYAESAYVHDLRFMLRGADGADGERSWRADLPPIHYCTHEIGPMLALLQAANGGRDRCVWATGLSTGSQVDPASGATDLEVGLFRTAGGVVLKVLCAFSIVREPWGHTRTVYGTHGCLESGRPAPGGQGSSGQALAYFDLIPDLKDMVPLTLGNARREAPPEALVPGGHGDGEYWLAQDFLRAVRGEAPPAIDVYDAVEYTLPGICAHQSARQGGTPVEIPNFRE